MPKVVSVSSSTASSPAGAEKAGQPQPESYFASESNSSDAAAGAPVRPGLEDVVVLPAERRLGPLVAEDPILLGRQLLAPLLLGLLDLSHEISLVGLGGTRYGAH